MFYIPNPSSRKRRSRGCLCVRRCSQKMVPIVELFCSCQELCDVVGRYRWIRCFQWLCESTKIYTLVQNDIRNPKTAPHRRHTIITTRNQHAEWIPAEPFAIPLLPPDEAVDMLFVLAGARIDGSWNRTVALDIVKEPGYLPLAIEQAAAYISQICSHDVSKFLSRYNAN